MCFAGADDIIIISIHSIRMVCVDSRALGVPASGVLFYLIVIIFDVDIAVVVIGVCLIGGLRLTEFRCHHSLIKFRCRIYLIDYSLKLVHRGIEELFSAVDLVHSLRIKAVV